MKLSRAQGMNDFGLSDVFNVLILSKMLHASQAIYMHVDELDSLQWGFTSVKYDIGELFELADYKFFIILSCNAEYCLNSS
jgi:hypothetical protein